MKKSLLFTAALLATSTMMAQGIRLSDQKLKPANPTMATDVMELATADFGVEKTDQNQYISKKKAPQVKTDMGYAWYHRPAGVFYGAYITKDENAVPTSVSSLYAPYLHASPYSSITYKNASTDATSWAWYSHQYSRAIKGYEWATTSDLDLVREQLILETDTVPLFLAFYGTKQSSYQLKGGKLNSAKSAVETEYISRLLSRVDYENAFSNTATNHLWYSSKYFAANTNRDFTKLAGSYYKTGAKDASGGTTGRWYGRNFSGVDGMAMAFEKPSHPYALRHVGVRYQMLKVNAPVTLYAKVYRLDAIPEFDPEKSVSVTPGELVAQGEVTVDNLTASSGILSFPMQEEEDGIVYDVSPTIDFPILVEVTGYNVDDMEDFTMLYSSDGYDEGHGELCYAKRLMSNGTYQYRGMNNFFTSGALYTGVTILIDTERPFMVYNYTSETGEREVPAAGEKYDVEVFSWHGGDEWSILDENDEDLPDWVTVEYADEMENGAYSHVTTVSFDVAPLPEGVSGRECVVKMMYPGAELKFKLTQGDPSPVVPGDIDGDGIVNVSDVTALINKILGEADYSDQVCDVDGNGEVNVSDVTALINMILG